MRFTIRDLLWLTVVVAHAMGWLLHSLRWSQFHAAMWAEGNETVRDIQNQFWEADGERVGLDFTSRQLQAELDGRQMQMRSLLQLNDDAPLPNYWEKLSATGQPISN